MTKTLIKSKKRVRDHGEVFTPEHIVKAMLDLVAHETENIGARFLEPACGDGNFLSEVLKRKLEAVRRKHKKPQLEYESYAFQAIGSLYGIDLLEDNVRQARKRLLDIFLSEYEKSYPKTQKEKFLESIRFVLKKNITQGDALTMLTKEGKPIIFPEWNISSIPFVKRRDFSFAEILQKESMKEGLFENMETEDLGLKPTTEYPQIHLYEVGSDKWHKM